MSVNIALECDNCGKYSVPAINDIDDALLNEPCKECVDARDQIRAVSPLSPYKSTKNAYKLQVLCIELKKKED